MTTLRTEVLSVSYRDAGPVDGPPVLILHGWPDSASAWTPIADQLAGLGLRTITPELRGHGGTRFLDASTVRDGRSVALAQDAVDLVDHLGLEQFAVVGHDWGARAGYTLAAVAPSRVTRLVTLSLGYQPHGVFAMPDFGQARAFWYQWLMYVDAGAEAIRRDPAGFARVQWETWSPPGWYDEAAFGEASRAFENPDWAAVTLSGYRSRFLADEPRDTRYDLLGARLRDVGTIGVDTLTIQGAEDYCDPPSLLVGQEKFFTGGYRLEVIDGVGHFPHREAPGVVASLIAEHVTMRAATAGDVEAIAEMWHRGWHDGHDGQVPAELASVRTPESFGPRAVDRLPQTTVAERGGEVAGFVVVVGDEVEQVYVSSAHRGGGAASTLLAAAERQVRAAGFPSAWLAVVAGNARARRFYEREGWVDEGDFDYAAESGDTTIGVPCRRYTKRLT
ncbi:alpha/beta fold hydrolase [Cryptosporangium sp. NPDC048952]|uniref:alpha/beta fold hydrolase n=1 Tax=Cryptosporangium sp. NPDC048952 TaxID=3363961 RepID=UPI00371CA4AE